MSWHIQKLGYSASPWRIVDDTGTQIYLERTEQTFHYGYNNTQTIDLPVYGYDTKAAAVDAVCRYAERAATRVRQLEAERAA